MRLLTALFIAPLTCLMVSTSAQAAEPLILRTTITDGDGRITASDVFENAGALGDLTLGSRVAQTATLDAAQVQGQVARAGAIWDNPRGLRRILVAAGADADAPSAPAPTTTVRPAAAAQSAQTVEVLVLTRSVAAGEIIQPQDIAFAPVQAHQAGADLPSNPQLVIGKAARWALRQGAPVHGRDLSSPTVIRRTEEVQVEWISTGVRLVMTGIAQRDAATGDTVMVLNPTSRKLIEAVATGPGRAAAGPGAAALRSPITLSQR